MPVITRGRRVVGDEHEVQVLRRDLAGRHHGVADPLEEAAPVLGAEEDDGEVPDLVRLDERERLEELVHRPEPPGEDDEGTRVLHEHRLADEEVPEVDRVVEIWVAFLLEGKLDVAPDRGDAGRLSAAIRSFHHARATARDDGETRLPQ